MTSYLLDTHAVLWWFTDSPRLSRNARDILGSADTDVFVSAASAWEIATKHRIGRLTHMPAIVERYQGLVVRNGFTELSVTTAHGLFAGSLVSDHRDPFDRMIAAQGILESLAVVSVDRAIAELGADVVW